MMNSCLVFLKDINLFDISQPEAVRERALRVFSKIEGLDDIKEMLLRALESPERARTLLIGPPACAKSLFMSQIEKYILQKVLQQLKLLKRCYQL
jgi:hypothetical protein